MAIRNYQVVTICSLFTALISCAGSSKVQLLSEDRSTQSIVGQGANTTSTADEQLTVAEYGPAAVYLGTWMIDGQHFLDLEPEGIYRLKNYFMGGDPDPNHWYQQGYWYVQNSQIILEHTVAQNARIIPHEFNQSTNTINIIVPDSGGGELHLQYLDSRMKKIENLSPQQVQYYRINRSRLKSNPVAMEVDEPSVATRLKKVAVLWGNWKAHEDVSISLYPNGQFIATNLEKDGWVVLGTWQVEGESVALETEHQVKEQIVPDYLSKPKILLDIVPSATSSRFSLNIGNVQFIQKSEE